MLRTDPFTLNMCGASITPAAVMAAAVGAGRVGKPAYARMHEAQQVAWCNCSVEVGVIKFTETELPDMQPRTIGGIPIRVDNTLYPDRIVYHDENGTVLSKIECLGIPCGFEGAYPALWNCKDQEELNEKLREWRFE